jgi:hypothetical protein
MKVFGWTVHLQRGEAREAYIKALLADACECLCLCASAGCGCATGEGEVLCSESSVGGRFRTLQSEGPGWVARVLEYDGVLRFEVATETTMGREIEELWRRVTRAGHPASPSSGMADA